MEQTIEIPNDEKMRVAYMLGFNEGYDRANEQSSLQQEQPVGEEYAIEIGKGVHTLRVGSQSDIDHLIHQEKQEQPEVDLEKEFKDYLGNMEGQPRKWHPNEQIEWAKDIARHFAEWGAIHLNARKEE